jgi:Domain of unknown function (DUF927)
MLKSRKNRNKSSAENSPSGWAVSYFRENELDNTVYIELTFPTEDGRRGHLTGKASIRHRLTPLIQNLDDQLAEYPPDVGTGNAGRSAFLRKLLQKRDAIDFNPRRLGFAGASTFVTYIGKVSADGTIEPRNFTSEGPEVYIDRKGTSKGFRNEVLKLARCSTYLAFDIGVALAAPLPAYLKTRGEGNRHDDRIIAEPAIFNHSGTSSSGKSSALMASIAVAGSPDRMLSHDFTARGLAERANDANDHLLPIDDTEKADPDGKEFVAGLKTLVRTVTTGRSRLISRGVDQSRFPPLRFSNLALSNSPDSLFALARKHRWTLSPGEKVRLFDIHVPGPKRGGIFDRLTGPSPARAEKSIGLIARLEKGVSRHHGHLMASWMTYLMSWDARREVGRLVKLFVDCCARPEDGWEMRFARKFGLVYAAIMIAIDAGLLPWRRRFAMKAVAKCYRKARRSAASDSEIALDAFAKFDRVIHQKGRLVDVTRDAKGRSATFGRKTIGVRYSKHGRRKFGVRDEALRRLFKSDHVRLLLVQLFVDDGVADPGHGHAGTAQERITIVDQGHAIPRPRLWVLDRGQYMRTARRKLTL